MKFTGYMPAHCHSAKEFMNKILSGAMKIDGFEWIFRGQNDDWSLLPKAMRYDFLRRYVAPTNRWYRINLEREQSRNLTRDERTSLKVHLQRRLEDAIVTKFADSADRAGLFVPTDSRLDLGGEYRREEVSAVYDALNGSPPLYRDPTSIVDALAQHHGIPTRLLDWTYNPLVAAFFAAYTNPFEEVKPNENRYKYMVVWAFNLDVALKCTDLALVTQLRSRIGHLQAQDGVFMYDKRADDKFRSSKRYVGIEEEFDKNEYSNGVVKYTIPFTERANMLSLLRKFEVSSSILMPSFDDIAQETLRKSRQYEGSLLTGMRNLP